MSADSPALALEGVSYRYDGDLVLDAIDLGLDKGERLVVLGPNGGGKTTLIELLLGLRRPFAGRRRLPAGSRAGRSSYVPQFAAFDRNFPIRVFEMVRQGRLRPGHRDFPPDDLAAVEAMLERLRLAHLRSAYLTELSGGELKRALIARALCSEPDLLALDEPTASLDQGSRGALWELLAELPGTTTIVLATHDLAPATFVPTRAVFVDRGLREIALTDLHAGEFLCGHGHD